MNVEDRQVTRIPVRELWDHAGTLAVTRGAVLAAHAIKTLLRTRPAIRFAVADVGRPPRWIEPPDTFDFWKAEVAPRLVDPAAAERGFALDAFPGGYAYVASEWLDAQDVPAVLLLETHH